MSKAHSLAFYSPPLLVEEKVVKESKVIRMQQIGSKKEHFIKFEVSVNQWQGKYSRLPSWLWQLVF